MGDLSHVDEAGDVRMVDVGGKPLSRRRAVAAATVRMAPETARRLRELPKGDALVTAQLAGDDGGQTHGRADPALPSPAFVEHRPVGRGWRGLGRDPGGCRDNGANGVEMEALVAASVAALTVYDMAKAIDKGMVVDGVRLLEKTKEPL